MSAYPRVLPVGDAAVTVELGNTIDPALNARVRALDRSLAESPLAGVLETLPSYRSLLVHYDARIAGFGALRASLLERLPLLGEGATSGALHLIPTTYGGDDGPDLAEVARAHGLSEAEVIALHSGCDYTAFMLGFTPGFAYLGLLPEGLETPRRATPRVKVAAGSVAIAGRQTAIYPVSSPGGWQLLGRASARLFDPHALAPALILPGDRVRFVPVAELPQAPARSVATSALSPATVEVLEPGLLTTVQDAGRFGHRRLGVAWAGAMDGAALRNANLAVGNDAGAAALECTIAGPALRFLATTHFVVTGADLGGILHRADLGAWNVPLGERVLARAGNVLAFEGRRSGCRAYLALAGGIDVPVVLGSRATDLSGGFGGFEGRALRTGDRLGAGASRGEPRPGEGSGDEPSSSVTVRVVLGPQHDHFEEESVARFLAETYALGTTSDRVGGRLAGPPLQHRGAVEIVSDGMVPGCVQVPPDGQPIVMTADGPTTGGYPKLATLVGADLPLLAQLLPGEGRVRFTPVALDTPRPR